MIDFVVDAGELAESVSATLGRRYRLTPLKVKCTYPVFRGEADDGGPVFVKVGTKTVWARTRDLLAAVGDCGFFSRFLTDRLIDCAGQAVFVMEWKPSRIVFPEDMNLRQVESFVAGCVKLSATLQRREVRVLADGGTASDSPEGLYDDLLRYVSRHPIAGRLLKELVSIPAAERTFGDRPRAVLHGDFHAKNFGFDGDEFAVVFDFDKLTEGLACGDLVHALVERFSCFHLSRTARRRLCDVTRRIVARAPWPREDFAVMCNVIRLQFAARRIRKHPDSAWVAFDVWRRDRKIRAFLECLGD